VKVVLVGRKEEQDPLRRTTKLLKTFTSVYFDKGIRARSQGPRCTLKCVAFIPFDINEKKIGRAVTKSKIVDRECVDLHLSPLARAVVDFSVQAFVEDQFSGMISDSRMQDRAV